MARQLGIMRVRGRLGNTVGYLARDGKGDKFDAIRDYGGQFSNPQTIRQMDQRMKMAPVVNFYRGLSQLLDHSWQTVKYGHPSRLFFYSQCMSRINTAGCPYLLKGDKKFVPWAFPISSGSIPVKITPIIGETVLDNNANMMSVAVQDIGEVSDGSRENTVASVSAVLKSIIGVQNGQQITLVWVYDEDGEYIPIYRRFIVNDLDSTLMADFNLDCLGNELAGGNYLSFVPYVASNDWPNQTCVACGMIISQQVNGVWQRNNATMVIAESLRTQYNSQAAYDAMLASYRTPVNTESDYYLNEGQGTNAVIRTVQEVTVPFGASETTVAYYQIGSNKYVPTFRQTPGQVENVYAYRKAGDYEFTKTNAESLGSASSYTDTQEEFATLGYTICSAAELRAIAPELIFPA